MECENKNAKWVELHQMGIKGNGLYHLCLVKLRMEQRYTEPVCHPLVDFFPCLCTSITMSMYITYIPKPGFELQDFPTYGSRFLRCHMGHYCTKKVKLHGINRVWSSPGIDHGIPTVYHGTSWVSLDLREPRGASFLHPLIASQLAAEWRVVVILFLKERSWNIRNTEKSVYSDRSFLEDRKQKIWTAQIIRSEHHTCKNIYIRIWLKYDSSPTCNNAMWG